MSARDSAAQNAARAVVHPDGSLGTRSKNEAGVPRMTWMSDGRFHIDLTAAPALFAGASSGSSEGET